jgi:hypothetical protein
MKKSIYFKLRRVFYPVILCIVFPAIISVSYCFREDVLNKVELYNTADSEDVPYYIEVLSVVPANGTTGAAVTSVIAAQFNDNIDMATVNSATFSVTDGVTPVTGEFSYEAQLKTVKFTPGTIAVPVNLASSQSYTVTLTTGILNIAGEPMAADYSWSFTTAAASVPEITVFSPLAEIFSGDFYDFGSVDNFGTRSVVMNIWNSGSGNLNIASIISNNAEFVVFVNPSPVTLIPGTNASFTLNFTPSTAGDKTAQVAIGSDDSDENPFIINLHGVSLATPAPEIQVTNSGLILITAISIVDFGTVPTGGTGTVTLIIHNIGSSALTVSGVSFGGTNPELFSTGFTSLTINPGLTGNLSISFSAAFKINARAELYINNNDGDENPFIIKLKGRTK